MIILNYNVNGLSARIDQLLHLISNYNPDIITLQESKCSIDTALTLLDCVSGAYKIICSPYTTKHHHGVITLVIHKLYDSNLILEQGRVLRVNLVGDLSVYNVYINQGQEIGSDEYNKKLTLMTKLIDWCNIDINIIVAGDFNICLTENDVWSTSHWTDNTLCCTNLERKLFNDLLNTNNLINIPVPKLGNKNSPTWYGYRNQWRQYDKDEKLLPLEGKYGIRCDYILTNIKTANNINVINTVRFPYPKPLETTSDHVPLLLEI